MEKKKAFYQSPVGILEIEEIDNHISSVRLVSDVSQKESDSTLVLDEAVKQLKEYFAGSRKSFDLPLKQEGTEFQKKAWNYLLTIPYGQTVSYKDEATGMLSPKACRAVGSANGKNNIAIIVPCHRVVNENKGLGGYAYGIEVKRFLLDMEKLYAGSGK